MPHQLFYLLMMYEEGKFYGDKRLEALARWKLSCYLNSL